jgi:hypothetical protein
LRDEILAVIGKYMTVDLDKVDVRIERGDVVSLLEIDIEIPALARLMLERRTGPFYPSQTCPRSAHCQAGRWGLAVCPPMAQSGHSDEAANVRF